MGRHRTFAKIDYVLDHKSSLNKYQSIGSCRVCSLTEMESNLKLKTTTKK